MKVYLSHDWSDAGKKGAEMLSERVKRAGFEPVAAQSRAGSDWQQALEQQFNDSDAFVFVVDPDAGRDRWIQREWSAAAEESWSSPGKPMIPVVVGGADVPPFLLDRQAIRVADGDDWEEVARTLVSALGSIGAVAAGQQPRSEETRVEQQQRLSEIATDAANREPSSADREVHVKALEGQLATLRSENAHPRRIAELEVKLADALKSLQRNDEALIHLQNALRTFRETPGEKGRDTDRKLARIHANLGHVLQTMGRRAEAREHWQSALALYGALEGPNSLMVASTHAMLASVNRELGDSKAADEHWRAALSNAGGALKDFLTGLPILGGFIEKLIKRSEEPVTKVGGEKLPPADKER
jgi:tetratricopeptide (TPR) repeat protein